MDRIARRVAARYALRLAMGDWSPPIPEWVFDRFGSKVAYSRSPGDLNALELAQESVHIMLPRLLELFRKRLGDRYSMNASLKGMDLFFYFSSPHPTDSIVLHLQIRHGITRIELNYIPYRLSTSLPDFTKAIGVRSVVDDPELAGIHVMRLARQLMDKVA